MHTMQTMTSTMGIMTLSRGPCDLDNMSLFQDLKLKRRKVDSRCSSDGESAADTSTSSPDPAPASPRADAGRASPAPDAARHATVIRTAPHGAPPPQAAPQPYRPRAPLNGLPPPAALAAPMSPSMSPSWRPAPAVVMGEAGGVRTMFWTMPDIATAGSSHAPPPLLQQMQSQHSQHTPVPDDAAARILLELGSRRGPPLDMELLWAGEPRHHALNLSAPPPPTPDAPDEDEQPMVCMICEDKATGLHYGIITCEGCKGFFKRTVQNRRVYTCVADGNCEITKAQRNRCQYCRFKKCIEQGMVLQAVREDRMPGGRNSGAVYNLYKVKYKKHKKGATKTSPGRVPPPPTTMKPPIKEEPGMVNGTILKTALTNPQEVVHLRQRLDSTVSSSRDRQVPLDRALQMIGALIDCDAMEDIATVRHLPDLLEDKSEIGDKLCKIGDSIVHKMVAWTKKLPFISEIPMEIHSKLLMDKWHEISVLTTAAYQAMHRKPGPPQTDHEQEFAQEVNANLRTLQGCLTTLMGRPITMEQLRLDVGLVVEKMTQITIMFRRIQLRMEEYVCLKVYILLNQEVELEGIQERYVQVLRTFLEYAAPHAPGRLHDLFVRIPEIQAAANLLLESKMFYVPFVLNSAEIR